MGDPFAWVGETIDEKYRVDGVVGEGGFGVVYRGHHLSFGEAVAIKCLKLPASLSEAERGRFRERFAEEGRLLHTLSKANAAIVQALDVGTAASPNGTWTPYLVLEWLEGAPLDVVVRQRHGRGQMPMRLGEAIELLSPVASALAEAHGQNVAHRDIKPANLFLARVGGRETLKVLDFGIAKVVKQSDSITAAFASTGAAPRPFTPQYGAPEQFNPRLGSSGPWTDVFALALVLVELLTGERALCGDDVIQLHVSSSNPGDRPTPRAHGVELDAAVEAVFERALSVEPRDRFADAGAFWRALVEAAESTAEPTPPRSPPLPSLDDASVPTAEFLDAQVGATPAPGVAPEVGDEPTRAPDAPAHTTEPSAAAVPPGNEWRRGRWLLAAVAAVAFGAVVLALASGPEHRPAPGEGGGEPQSSAVGAPPAPFAALPASATASTVAVGPPASARASATAAELVPPPEPTTAPVEHFAHWPPPCVPSARPCGTFCCRSGQGCQGACDMPLPQGARWDLRLDQVYVRTAREDGPLAQVDVRLVMPDGRELPVSASVAATVSTEELLAGFELALVQSVHPKLPRYAKLRKVPRRSVDHYRLCRGLQIEYQEAVAWSYRAIWFWVDRAGSTPPERCR